MQPAADEMAEALANTTIISPRAPLVANITAGPVHDPDVIRGLLVEQVTGRVRWRESMIWLAGEGGITRFAEAGAGKVLSGMAKRIAPDAEATPLNSPADLEAFAKSLYFRAVALVLRQAQDEDGVTPVHSETSS